jgi:hypothetical protein
LLSLLAPVPAAAATPVVCDTTAFACPATGICIVSGTWRIGDACSIDFGARSVVLRGTLRGEAPGTSFSLAAADFTLDGGKIELPSNPDDYGGELEIVVAGAFTMQGLAPRIAVDGSGGAGDVTIHAGSVSLAAGTISANGGKGEDCGDAGIIEIDASAGPIRVENVLRARTPGHDCDGGDIELAAPSILVSGIIDARGGAEADFTAVDLEALDGDLTVTEGAKIRIDGTGQEEGFGGAAGGALLFATGDIVMAGTISGRAAGVYGSGGGVFIQADGSVDLSGSARLGSGFGGELLLNGGGPVTVTGDVDASGGSHQFSSGGTIQIRSTASLVVAGLLDSSGWSAEQMFLTGNPLTLTGTVRSRGSSEFGGGFVDVEGCAADLAGTIDVRGVPSDGGSGTIQIGVTAVQIDDAARLVTGAAPCLFGVCIDLRTASGGLVVAPGATVVPAPTVSTDDTLVPCS